MEAISEAKAYYRPLSKYRDYLLPTLVLAVACYTLRDYFMPGIQITLAILVAPFVFRIKEPGIVSYHYAFAALLFLVLYMVLTTYVLLFLSIGCLLLFSISCRFGKLGLLPFLFLACISPALNYVVSVFTFSIRLELSKYACLMLRKIGYAVENKGAYFILPDGYSFSVDTACIGLNLFSTGLCMVLLLIGFAQQRTKKQAGISSLLIIFTAALAALVFTNLLRIVAIVFFRAGPGTVGHEVIGILSLALYTLGPIYFLVVILSKRWSDEPHREPLLKKPPFIRHSFLVVLLCAATLTLSGVVKQGTKHGLKDETLEALQLPGYSKQQKEDGVCEFRKESVLIYIKPANKVYGSDHPPSMCWQGSGFQLHELTEKPYGTFTVLSAVLKRDAVVQYTAWWYDNGADKTISQWKWRLAKGKPYRIINITTDNPQELDRLCRFYLKQHLF